MGVVASRRHLVVAEDVPVDFTMATAPLKVARTS